MSYFYIVLVYLQYISLIKFQNSRSVEVDIAFLLEAVVAKTHAQTVITKESLNTAIKATNINYKLSK